MTKQLLVQASLFLAGAVLTHVSGSMIPAGVCLAVVAAAHAVKAVGS